MVAAISGGLTVQVDRLGLRVGGQPALSLQNEPGELSQWLCHDDSTINIMSVIIIIIIITCNLAAPVPLGSVIRCTDVTFFFSGPLCDQLSQNVLEQHLPNFQDMYACGWS